MKKLIIIIIFMASVSALRAQDVTSKHIAIYVVTNQLPANVVSNKLTLLNRYLTPAQTSRIGWLSASNTVNGDLGKITLEWVKEMKKPKHYSKPTGKMVAGLDGSMVPEREGKTAGAAVTRAGISAALEGVNSRFLKIKEIDSVDELKAWLISNNINVPALYEKTVE